jgi:hypothetical protein
LLSQSNYKVRKALLTVALKRIAVLDGPTCVAR